MKTIDPTQISENTIKLIGADWMLISVGTKEKFNTMTANWGGLGFIWNKSCAFILVRPQRYTFEFLEKEENFTLSFFSEKYKDALKICGSKSGRDCDKIALTNLTSSFTENGTPYFAEAKLVLECKKLYAQTQTPENFIDKDIITKWYPAGDFHKIYIAEIINAFEE